MPYSIDITMRLFGFSLCTDESGRQSRGLGEGTGEGGREEDRRAT
jgi:hypothetical protein